MRRADPRQMEAPLTARIKTHRGLEMLYRQVCLTGEQTQPTTPIPAIGKARIERERAIDQGQSGIDVFAEAPEHHGGTAENPGVVGGGAKSRRAKSTAISRFSCASRSSLQSKFSRSIR